MSKIIKVGYCVAYDWEYLKIALPLIYKSADLICLSIDINRKTWVGNKYEIDNNAFHNFVFTIDTHKKIEIYEDDFYIPSNTAMQNEVRQRKLIAEKMGKGGWHIQLDTDEYFLDFDKFVNYLLKIEKNPSGKKRPINIKANWIPIIKQLNNGFLYVDFEDKLGETFSVATNCPKYLNGRNNDYFNILSPFYCIHQTQARSPEDLKLKLNNWGHSDNELKQLEVRESLFNLWNTIDEFNYNRIKNCHFTNPKTWPALHYVKAKNINELIQNIKQPKFPLSKIQLKLKNSIWYSRLSKIFPFLQIK
ncbi:MAG: hypothetical protein H6553_00400 [Chitinophagales bacterium]|nr:hypothetical protein [Chitinophagales bacterium]